MTDKQENNEQLDADILQSKKDVLRARDIIPSEPKGSEKSEKQPTKAADTAAHTSKQGRTAGIPRFDLAEKILAEQRKTSAGRRKAPVEKAKAQVPQPIPDRPKQAVDSLRWQPPGRDSVVAEIVSRDIQQLQQDI